MDCCILASCCSLLVLELPADVFFSCEPPFDRTVNYYRGGKHLEPSDIVCICVCVCHDIGGVNDNLLICGGGDQ